MTALLEALRRIDAHRSTHSMSAVSFTHAAPATAVAAPHVVVASQPVVESPAEPVASIPLRSPRYAKPVVSQPGELPLSARATIAADYASAATAIVTRFRSPSLVALVTCGSPTEDVEVVESIGAAIEALGFATKIFGPTDGSHEAYGLDALRALRKDRGYHLLHTTNELALEQSPLLALADGVVMLIELERTPIREAEEAVGALRREAVAVSGILLIA
ncbi:MAG: hypothetical protein K8U03_04845 [Planctomycetia bacterium]|nr:hypothetical protein [Planctomycetia bacterium]